MNYNEIGRIVKSRHPGVYDGYEDYKLGQAYAEKYGLTHEMSSELALTPDEIYPLPPPSSVTTHINVQSDAFFFVGWRTSHLAKQIEHINAQYAKDHALRQAAFDHAHHDEKMLQQHYLQKAQYILQIVSTRALAQDAFINQEIGKEAQQYGLDRITYLAYRLQQLTIDEKARERETQLEQDRRHKEENARIEREDAAAKAVDYIRSATAGSLANRQRLKTLYAELRQLRETEYEIETGNKPLKLKAQLLEDVHNEIAGVRKEIDGLEELNRKADTRQTAGRSDDEAANA